MFVDFNPYLVCFVLQGRKCESCKPLYIGDPGNKRHCVSCYEFCNHHSSICVYYTNATKRYERQIDGLLRRFPDTRSAAFLEEVKLTFMSGWQKKKEVARVVTVCTNFL